MIVEVSEFHQEVRGFSGNPELYRGKEEMLWKKTVSHIS